MLKLNLLFFYEKERSEFENQIRYTLGKDYTRGTVISGSSSENLKTNRSEKQNQHVDLANYKLRGSFASQTRYATKPPRLVSTIRQIGTPANYYLCLLYTSRCKRYVLDKRASFLRFRPSN